MRSGGFDPASLFAGGIAGAWYDPSDIDTLFQDSAGTTSVTASGQPVGLMLDKSKGLVLGPELVTNGDFANNVTGWTDTANAVIAYESGEASVTVASASNGTAQTLSDLTIGASYRISGVARLGTNATVADLRVLTTVGALVFNIRCSSTSTAVLSGIFVATATEHVVRLQPAASVYPAVAFYDNISVRELPGNHATQTTAAARPIYQTAPDRVTINGVDDRMTVTVPVGGFTGTMVLATDQGTASYGVTIPAGAYEIGGRGGLYFPGNAIVGQLIRNGALSEGEAAATEAYFVEKGATASYGAVTDFSNFWRDWLELTSFPLIDTSAGTRFDRACQNCSSLTSFPANAFDNVQGGDFTDAFTNTALTQASIDNVLVSLVASGISAGTRVFNQSGGSAPSSTGEAAIDTLRSRGWTVTVTGGY